MKSSSLWYGLLAGMLLKLAFIPPAVAQKQTENQQVEFSNDAAILTAPLTGMSDDSAILSEASSTKAIRKNIRLTNEQILDILVDGRETEWSWHGADACDVSKRIFYADGEYAEVRKVDGEWRLSSSASSSHFTIDNGVITFVDGRNRGRPEAYPPQAFEIIAITDSRIDFSQTYGESSTLERCSPVVNREEQQSSPISQSPAGTPLSSSCSAVGSRVPNSCWDDIVWNSVGTLPAQWPFTGSQEVISIGANSIVRNGDSVNYDLRSSHDGEARYAGNCRNYSVSIIRTPEDNPLEGIYSTNFLAWFPVPADLEIDGVTYENPRRSALEIACSTT